MKHTPKLISNAELAALRLKLITASQMAGTLHECNDPRFIPWFRSSAQRAIRQLQKTIDKVDQKRHETATPDIDHDDHLSELTTDQNVEVPPRPS